MNIRSFSTSLIFIVLLAINQAAMAGLNLSAPSTPNQDYSWDSLAAGNPIYIDRSYTIQSVPTAYNGMDYLKTANDDKKVTDDNFLQFEVPVDVTVYIAHDVRISPKPAWMGNWSDSGEEIVTSDATLRLFAKDFPAGNIVLGGNNGGNASSMYAVLVFPKDPSQATDTTPPSTPNQLTATAVSEYQVNLSWQASADDTALAGYRIYRNGTEMGTTASLSFADTGLSPETTYSYTVAAFDTSNNLSPASTAATATTMAANTGSASLPDLARGYQWDSLAIGKPTYIDKDYTYTAFPDHYANMAYVQTAHGDKFAYWDNFLTLDFTQGGTLYVAYDPQISPRPTWLQDWTDTGENIQMTRTTLRVFSKTFVAGPVTLGGNSGKSGNYMYGILVALNGGGSNQIPFANADAASTDENIPVTIDVLANDTGLGDAPITVSIASPAGTGNISVGTDNRITYTPNADTSGSDSFMYRVSDSDGDAGMTTVSITVNCLSCVTGRMVNVAWTHPAPESVDGYLLYRGASPETANEEIANLSTVDGSMDPAAPAVQLDSETDLGLQPGDPVCFSTKAYNAYGVSDFSETVCTTI